MDICRAARSRSKSHRRGALLLSVSLVLFAFLGGVAVVEAGESVPPVLENSPKTKKIADNGNLQVTYKLSNTNTSIADAVKDSSMLKLLMPDLNRSFALPKDLSIVFSDCGEINAFYSKKSKDITICYELVDYLSQSLRRGYAKTADADAALTNAIAFVFFHELGHALIDIYDLSITGKEEDAADQLATVILLELEHGGVMAIHGALAFGLLAADDTEVDELPFWDEHSFGRQRYFNVICWVYGSNPDPTIKDAVAKGGLPESRSSQCVSEYKRMHRAWLKLLSPFLKAKDTAL
jgi:hypothetical protein